jgi:alkanesulfonate monooxygenase SsuD/methylene tetrahydromethanopterin reductase-like flavin-dependent oxidoreductase (luciferase family)
VKFGKLFLIPTPDASLSFKERYDRFLEMCALGDDRGFDGIWVTEHHFSDYGYSPNPLMLLAEAARVAPNARLGTAVLVLPLWNPVRLAEDIATLDVFTDGRVDVGIGRGYQKFEFASLQADLSKNRDVFNEALNIMLAAWSTDDFEYSGKQWTVPPTTVFPKPVQSPHPPIWMAATTPPSIRNAVERGFHVATGTGALLDELQMRNAFIDDVLHTAGRPADSIERAVNRFIFCSTSKSEIEEAIEQSRWQIRVSRTLSGGQPPVRGRNAPASYVGEVSPEIWQQRMIIGDPDECLVRLRQLGEVGVTYVYGLFDFGGLDHGAAIRSLKLFSEEVLPAARSIEPRYLDEAQREAVKSSFLAGGPGYAGI